MLKEIEGDFQRGTADKVLYVIARVDIVLEEKETMNYFEKMAKVEVESEQIDGQSGEELGYEEEPKIETSD